MNEERTTQAEIPIVEPAPGEKHSAVIVRGISMPAHQVRIAIEQAVARGQVSEEDGEGYSLEELNGAAASEPGADEPEADGNAAALALLGELVNA